MAPNATGWNKPLDIDLRMHLPEIAGALLEGYDASGIGKRSGELRRALSLPSGNYRATRTKRGDIVRWSTTLPYARIQDIGGNVPERRPRRAKAMRWADSSGELIFAKRTRGFHLPGFGFLSRHGVAAIDRRLSTITDVKWGGK